MPGCEGQVTASDWDQCHQNHQNCDQCQQTSPCLECQYWPIYPCFTPEKPMVDCISEYTNDQVSVNPENPNVESTGLYMYDKLIDEGM